MKLGKLFSFAALSFVLAACSGGGGSGGDSVNGELPETSSGSPETSEGSGSQQPQLIIQGLIGENIDGSASVEVKVGDIDYDATVDGKIFSAEIKNAASDELISVVVRYPATEERKEVVLKSYVGKYSQIEELENEGSVSVSELPTLYVNALSTASAAFLEKVNEGDITTSNELLSASQVLPQEILLESAVGLRYIVSGGESPLFSHENTYDFIRDYPVAAKVALELKNISSSGIKKYEQIFDQLVNNKEQILSVENYSGEDLIFVAVNSTVARIYGFAMNLTGGESGTGYFADSNYSDQLNNSVSYVKKDNLITLEMSGSDRVNFYFSECWGENGSSGARLNSVRLKKYYDAAFYSAYKVDYDYSCQQLGGDEVSADSFVVSSFAQVNTQRTGSLEEISSDAFSISGFRDRSNDDSLSRAGSWEPSIIDPNTKGTVNQRFDHRSGYVDDGKLSFSDAGNLVIESNRGSKVEYYTFGSDGVAMRTLGVLRRDDGSLASVGGHYATPVVQGTEMPVGSDIFNYGGIFDLFDPEFPNYYDQFGFRYYEDGSGYQVYKGPEYITEAEWARFGWSDKENFREQRYFVDFVTRETYSSCPEGNMNCVEWRYREVEPLFFDGTFYYLRVYQEIDNCKLNGRGSCVEASGYIDRWKVSAIQ
ncbi:hypothetical protein MJO52_00890 [Microbulbifer variabilis]|uniref:Lipoprotein n=1 Tax=Microbulbifer variabilis TaxID=266805 RepID=A0ABY4VIK1_9GAMM|nr:hypothetical protein [Microbulbifer variabilis]USD21729.1 hypothetical protein MJO52_00890 [Microbulbifer variabilis]